MIPLFRTRSEQSNWSCPRSNNLEVDNSNLSVFSRHALNKTGLMLSDQISSALIGWFVSKYNNAKKWVASSDQPGANLSPSTVFFLMTLGLETQWDHEWKFSLF